MKRLRTQVNAVQEQGYDVMVVGDFNGHIGDGLDGIEGGDQDKNRNGRRLLSFSRETGFRIVNRDMVCKGKWTWNSGDRRSIIDYIFYRPFMKNSKGYLCGCISLCVRVLCV